MLVSATFSQLVLRCHNRIVQAFASFMRLISSLEWGNTPHGWRELVPPYTSTRASVLSWKLKSPKYIHIPSQDPVSQLLLPGSCSSAFLPPFLRKWNKTYVTSKTCQNWVNERKQGPNYRRFYGDEADNSSVFHEFLGTSVFHQNLSFLPSFLLAILPSFLPSFFLVVLPSCRLSVLPFFECAINQSHVVFMAQMPSTWRINSSSKLGKMNVQLGLLSMSVRFLAFHPHACLCIQLSIDRAICFSSLSSWLPVFLLSKIIWRTILSSILNFAEKCF